MYYSMMNTLPDLESVLPLTSRRVKQMNFMSEETRMLKRKFKKEKKIRKRKQNGV